MIAIRVLYGGLFVVVGPTVAVAVAVAVSVIKGGMLMGCPWEWIAVASVQMSLITCSKVPIQQVIPDQPSGNSSISM